MKRPSALFIAFSAIGILATVVSAEVTPQEPPIVDTQRPVIKKDIAPAVAVQAQKVELKILEGKDFVGTGLFSDYGAWFSVPKSVEITENAELVYTLSHSKVLSPTSTLTVWFNGHPIQSINLDSSSGKQKSYKAEIPLYLFKPGYDQILFRFFTISDVDNPERDLSNPANWVVLHKESYLKLDYRIREANALSVFPEPFIGMGKIHQLPLAVALPQEPSREELQTAAVLIQYFAQKEPFLFSNIPVILGNDIPKKISEKYNLLSVGTLERYPLLSGLERQLPPDVLTQLDEQQGMIALVRGSSKTGSAQLSILGDGPGILLKSAEILTQPKLTQRMEGSYELIGIDQTVPIPPAHKKIVNPSLKDMGHYAVKLAGTSESSETFTYVLPPHWEIGRGAYLMLDITSSPLLDTENSVISVVVNDKPVRSFRFAGAEEHKKIKIRLPEEVFEGRTLDVTVKADLQIEGQGAINRHYDEAWVILHESSFFHLPHRLTQDVNFRNFPALFYGNARPRPVKIVIPDFASQELIGTAFNIIYGAASLMTEERVNHFDIVKVSEVTEPLLENFDLVLIGNVKNNPFLKKLNKDLPLPLDPETGRPIRTRLAVLPQFLQDVAVLEIVQSPWNPKRNVLFVSGAREGLMQEAVQLLLDRKVSSRWDGNIILVNEKSQWDSLAYKTYTVRYEGERKGFFIIIWAAVSVLVLGLVGVIIYLKRKHGLMDPFRKA